MSDGPTSSAAWERCRQAVLTHGHRRLDAPVQLRSGAWSTDFVDAKRALARGDDLRAGCEALVELLDRRGIVYDAVGGMTMGADQFAHGIALLTGCSWFVVRKQAKGRGTNQVVEGAELGPGTRAVVLEDVVSTGGSMHQAYERVVETGATVVAALALVDRGRLAAGFFDERAVPYAAVLTFADLGIEPLAPPDLVSPGPAPEQADPPAGA